MKYFGNFSPCDLFLSSKLENGLFRRITHTYYYTLGLRELFRIESSLMSLVKGVSRCGE